MIDVNPVVKTKSIRYAGKSIEVMALDETVKEIMSSDRNATVTYLDNSYKNQGTTSFPLLSIFLSGLCKALPTLNIASESKDNLAKLKTKRLQAVFSIGKGINTWQQ